MNECDSVWVLGSASPKLNIHLRIQFRNESVYSVCNSYPHCIPIEVTFLAKSSACKYFVGLNISGVIYYTTHICILKYTRITHCEFKWYQV